MSRLYAALLALLLTGCPVHVVTEPEPPKPPAYDAACQALLDAGATFGTKCSTETERYVHNPTQDPKHCEPTPACSEPPGPPIPAGGACFLTTEDEGGGAYPIPKPPQAVRDQLRSVVLATLETLSGCQRGSRCLIDSETQSSWQARVVQALVENGICAMPRDGHGIDQISVARFVDGRCDAARQNYDVFQGDDHDIPVPAGQHRQVVWAAELDAWAVNGRNDECSTPEPPHDTMGCQTPLPPPVNSVTLKVYNFGGYNLDGTVRVCDIEYQKKIANAIGVQPQKCGPVRPECGPDGMVDGRPCIFTDRRECEAFATQNTVEYESDGPIEVKPDNPYRALFGPRSSYVTLCVGKAPTRACSKPLQVNQ